MESVISDAPPPRCGHRTALIVVVAAVSAIAGIVTLFVVTTVNHFIPREPVVKASRLAPPPACSFTGGEVRTSSGLTREFATALARRLNGE
jgi:hypothetical protein